MYPLISGETAFESVPSFSESSLWLFDTFLDLRLAERRWQSLFPDSPTLVIEMTLKIIRAVCHKGDPVFTLRNKACSLLVLLCGEMIPNPDSLITLHLTKPDVQRTYCVALLTIAQAAIRDFSMARLTASRLVNQLWLHFPSIPEETDTWVCENEADPMLALIMLRGQLKLSIKLPLLVQNVYSTGVSNHQISKTTKFEKRLRLCL